MSSGNRVLYCFALFALVQQIYAATTYNLNASDTTEVYVSESVTVVFPPTKGAFAQVAVANASLPSYQDPTASAPGLFANVTIFIAVYDSKTRLTTQPPSPIYVKIFGEELTADHQLYIWNSVVQKWYPAAETCSNGTLSFGNDTLSVPVCHVGQLALFDMRTETDGGGALKDPTSSDKPSKAGVIAAAVIVPIVVVIIVIVLVYMFMIRYRQRSKSNADLEKAPRITPQLTTTVVKTNDEEEVDSYSSNSSASSVSSYTSQSEGEKQEDKPPVIVVESTPQVQEPIKNEEPSNTEEKPEEDEKDETSSASSSSSSSSSSSDSDSDSSSSESD